ncbi:MAG TPA: DsbA family protein, partial [Polyangiaceae bacterium]|nr:DsbA family protein [Polyangiaceae bacterium]
APLTTQFIGQTVKKLGLDAAAFDRDVRSDAVADVVARDKKQGREVQLKGTPSIFINGREFNYQTDLSRELKEWFALERKLHGQAKP